MKSKSLSVLVLLVILPCAVAGQQLGVTLGTGISKYNFRQVNYPTYVSQYESFEHTPILSTYVGVDLKLKLNEAIFCKVGLGYSMNGNRERTVYNSYIVAHPDTTVRRDEIGIFRQHYINIPVTVHFQKIYFFIGGQISYLSAVGTQYKNENSFTYNGNVYLVQNEEGKGTFDLGRFRYFNRLDFGAVAGFEYPLSTQLDISLRYYQGLRGVLYEDFFINYKNAQLLLTLSYRLAREP